MLGFAVGCVIFGAMAGNLAAGPVSDRFGRKNTLIVVAALFTISATWSALASGYTEFIIARIIGGVGIGGAILGAMLAAGWYVTLPTGSQPTVTRRNLCQVLLGRQAPAVAKGVEEE